MTSPLFATFLSIARALNERGLVPLLMGSVGLEVRTGRSWQARDLDIHVPGDPRGWEAPDHLRIYDFELLEGLMEDLGYVLVDRHEHEFQGPAGSVEFGALDTLPDFAGVALEDLPLEDCQGVRFYLPTMSQYLAIYQASSQDSYRNDQNNHKDFAKIAYLEERLALDCQTKE